MRNSVSKVSCSRNASYLNDLISLARYVQMWQMIYKALNCRAKHLTQLHFGSLQVYSAIRITI